MADQNQNQPSQTALVARNPVSDFIQKAKPNLLARLPQVTFPSDIDKDRFVLGIMTAIAKSKASAPQGKSLADCDPNSVMLAAYDAAEVGCNLSPALQLGWLIPYGKEANFQPSYRFFIQKAYETGDVKTFFAEVVYAGDKLERQYAPKRNLFHAPGDGPRVKEKAIGAYALIEYMDGTIDWEYMDAELIERHRKHSKQPNSMMWTTFWEEGFRKTPIRSIFKRIPLKSRELERLAEMVGRDTERELAIPESTPGEAMLPKAEIPTQEELEQRSRIHQLCVKLEFNQAREDMLIGQNKGDLLGLEAKLKDLLPPETEPSNTETKRADPETKPTPGWTGLAEPAAAVEFARRISAATSDPATEVKKPNGQTKKFSF